MLRHRGSGEPNDDIACNPLNPTYTMPKANEVDPPPFSLLRRDRGSGKDNIPIPGYSLSAGVVGVSHNGHT